jgi:hypothetical protein
MLERAPEVDRFFSWRKWTQYVVHGNWKVWIGQVHQSQLWKNYQMLLFFFLGWSGTESTITEAITGLLYQSQITGLEQLVECLHYHLVVDSASSKNEYQKIFLRRKARPARKADNLTAISWTVYLENVRSSTSHNLVGLQEISRKQTKPCFITVSCLVDYSNWIWSWYIPLESLSPDHKRTSCSFHYITRLLPQYLSLTALRDVSTALTRQPIITSAVFKMTTHLWPAYTAEKHF